MVGVVAAVEYKLTLLPITFATVTVCVFSKEFASDVTSLANVCNVCIWLILVLVNRCSMRQSDTLAKCVALTSNGCDITRYTCKSFYCCLHAIALSAAIFELVAGNECHVT